MITTGAALLLPLLLIIVPWYPGQLVVGLLLIAFWPGYALLAALWPGTHDSPLAQLERGLMAVAVSYGLTITLLLLMAFVRIPFNTFSVVSGLAGLTLLFTLIAWRQQSDRPESKIPDLKPASGSGQPPTSSPTSDLPNPTSYLVWVVIILLIAAFFRVANVYYSDHQGDEADILLRAMSLVYGNVEAILTHSKGPGEILLLNAIGALTGRFDEQTVRLPFSLAGTASIGLIVLLGGRLFNRQTGIVAGLLAAIDGVFVSYARTAQYQSGVLLLTLAAIYCFYRFRQTGGQSRRLHGLGTFLLAASFLVHFETILLLPVVVYLTVSRFTFHVLRFTSSTLWVHLSRLPSHISRLTYLWPSILIFVATTTIFYLPFLLHPNVGKTGTYLENRIGGGSLPPFNNLGHFFYIEALKYNSAYYVVLFNVCLLVVVVIALIGGQEGRRAEEQGSRGGKPVRSFSTSLLASLSVIILIIGGVALALAGVQKLSAVAIGLGLTVIFALMILSPNTALPHRTLWLWIAPPFLVCVFLVNRPGKHHYLFMAALVILVGLVLTEGWQRATTRWSGLRQPVGQGIMISLSLVLLLIFAAHTVMVLLRSDLEYVLTYPDHKSAFYPTDADYPYRARIGFGYPFRLGWQVIGQLKRTGQLEGTWAGNDEGNAPNWYMLNTPASPCYPDYVLQGEITYKGDNDFNVPFRPNDFGYVPRYRIWGNDRLRMTVLEFNPAADETEVIDLYETSHFDPPVTAADFAAGLPAQSTSEPDITLAPALVLGEGSELKQNAPPEYLERAKQLEGRVALMGYDLDTRYAYPAGIVPVTLYWQTQNLLSLRYKVFVHLTSSEGQLWTQADDFPVCGTSHANTWLPGTFVLDRHLLKLPPDIPAGEYTLRVGMYEPDLNLRLNYFDVAGNEQGNSLTIGTVMINPESGGR